MGLVKLIIGLALYSLYVVLCLLLVVLKAEACLCGEYQQHLIAALGHNKAAVSVYPAACWNSLQVRRKPNSVLRAAAAVEKDSVVRDRRIVIEVVITAVKRHFQADACRLVALYTHNENAVGLGDKYLTGVAYSVCLKLGQADSSFKVE